MATAEISVDIIFDEIYNDIDQQKLYQVDTLNNADNVILVNSVSQKTKTIDTYDNFVKLLTLMTNTQTDTNDRVVCSKDHEGVAIKPHDWCARQNIFRMFVRPFIDAENYSRVKDQICFKKFISSNFPGYANKCVKSGDYYYWPNMAVIYCGWNIYLKKQFNINMDCSIPLINNRRLGNVNLFINNPEDFLNVELSLVTSDNRTLFVNGRSMFTEDDDDLFIITMDDDTESKCKIKPELVYSNKNFFDYIKDDISLKNCVTADDYKDILYIDLKSLRVFEDKIMPSNAIVTKEKLKVFHNITPSSENIKMMQQCISDCVTLIKEKMIEVMSHTDQADASVLRNYFIKSDFVNFDYIIIVLWRTISKNEDMNLTKTDLKLYFELLCETIFGEKGPAYDMAKERCEPYCLLTPKIFLRLCNHWTMFTNENPCVTLAFYYAIHFLIYCKHGNWEYTYENAKTCGTIPEVLCAGFFKKIVSSGNMTFVFNGKHYVSVRKDDDLYKLTENCTSITMPSIKFNNWKYMYFTDEGVYNLFINDFHSGCPFLMGNTLVKSLTHKNEKIYLPQTVIQYMLDTGKVEIEIYKIYHMAKVCREIKNVKNNMTSILAFNNCASCKFEEQKTLNDLYREIWAYNHDELIITGVYLNDIKMSDLIINLKCYECKEHMHSPYKRDCSCLNKLEIDVKAFKVVLIMELFTNCKEILELVWSLLYTSSLYTTILLYKYSCDNNMKLLHDYGEFFTANRTKIINLLYNWLDNIDFVDSFVASLSCPEVFLNRLKNSVLNNSNDVNEFETIDAIEKFINSDSLSVVSYSGNNDDDDNDNNDIHNYEKSFLKDFYYKYYTTLSNLKTWNVWWDKLIVMRHNDDLNTWLTRFFMRIFMTKMELEGYPYVFIKQVVIGYLYFRQFTNFNYTNSLVVMHFAAGTGIPTDYEKCCLYLNGKPGSGKSSFFAVLEPSVVVHKHDSAKYTLTKKDTNEMEADKMISQLYVINEMKVCDDSFFKSTADSTKSNSVCRKYEGSQKYEANFKLLIVNNKPLHISDYDKGVRNRFAVIYTDHLFEENVKFNGSIYWHIKNKMYPMEKSYIDEMAKPVRMFLSHILMYKRNSSDGYVSYKCFLEKDPIHNHNLMCLDVNNSPLNALIYVLKVNVKPGARMVDESKIEKMIELAVPYVETMLHELLVTKRTNVAQRTAMLFDAFKRKFKKYYLEERKIFYNIDMAWNKGDFNINQPEFIC
uniref:Helicase n=1 Tax=Spodoptera frugiperda nuclear polyhedrosis virus TaxID=10455 RepID=A0A7G3W7S3_NPVSF|nr:helicase [Spodoptera frugiperda multiple nucleopolyhedrovirus]